MAVKGRPHSRPGRCVRRRTRTGRRGCTPSAAAEDDPRVAAADTRDAGGGAARAGAALAIRAARLVAEAGREAAIRGWLARNAPDQDADAIVAEVLRVMTDGVVADFFSADVYSEAPLSAIVGEKVITGTIDKLIVTDTVVRALDFKTGLNAVERPGGCSPRITRGRWRRTRMRSP